MKKIRHLSLIELTAFFDAFRIQLKRNKTEKVKGRGMKTYYSSNIWHVGIRQCFSDSLFLSLLFYNEDSGIFGVPLTVLLENDRRKDSGVKVPLVLQKVSTVYITGKFIELCACSMLFINHWWIFLDLKTQKPLLDAGFGDFRLPFLHPHDIQVT